MGITRRKLQLDDDTKPLTFGGSGHIMGTTRMGDDKANSVVDKQCRAHDHQNLFILGSSVFPTSSTANPTSTIAALSLRAVDTIRAQLRGVTI
jgi:choline dehydrogenase-like flavoprotein